MDLGTVYAWLGRRTARFRAPGEGVLHARLPAFWIGQWWLFPKEFRKDPR